MARPAGFEPATLGLAYHLQLSLLSKQFSPGTFVVWTISSPLQVPHVWPLRNPEKISHKIHILGLIILRRFYPQSDGFVVVTGIQIIALVSFRTINAIKIYIIFINCLHVCAILTLPNKT